MRPKPKVRYDNPTNRFIPPSPLFNQACLRSLVKVLPRLCRSVRHTQKNKMLKIQFTTTSITDAVQSEWVRSEILEPYITQFSYLEQNVTNNFLLSNQCQNKGHNVELRARGREKGAGLGLLGTNLFLSTTANVMLWINFHSWFGYFFLLQQQIISKRTL